MTKTIYICAWLAIVDGIPVAEYQESSVERFREESVVSAGIERDNIRVMVYSDNVHGIDHLKPDELRLVAKTHLDYMEKRRNEAH